MGERFKRIGLNKKIIIAYVPILILAISVCFLQFGRMLNVVSVREVSDTKVKLLKHVSDKLDYVNQHIVTISNAYLLDHSVSQFFIYNRQESAFERNRRFRQVEETLMTKHTVFSSTIFYTTLYGYRDDAYYTNSTFATREQDDERAVYYTELLNGDKSRLIWTHTSDYNGVYVLSAVRHVVNVHTGEIAGMMIYDFEESMFSDLFEEHLDEGEILSIMMENGHIISSSDVEMIAGDMRGTQLYEEVTGYKEGYFNLRDNDSMVSFVKNNQMNWYIISQTPMSGQSFFYSVTFRYLLVFVLVILIIFLLVTWLISRYITKPINLLIREIKEYRQREETGPQAEEGHLDEIGYLKAEYRKMVCRINLLISQIIEEQEGKRAFEIKALQNQINPHFLYNTLHSVRYLNRIGDVEKTDETIRALVNLLSNLFQKSGDMHTIDNELQLLKDYVYIQQIRYGNNFEVEFDCEAKAGRYPIAKLILQPIVENSIFHGLSSYEEGGLIRIYIQCVDTGIYIRVSDNGTGVRQQIQTGADTIVRHGIGLDNIQSRLQLYYGCDCQFRMHSEPGRGTIVEMIIPYQEGGEANESYDC